MSKLVTILSLVTFVLLIKISISHMILENFAFVIINNVKAQSQMPFTEVKQQYHLAQQFGGSDDKCNDVTSEEHRLCELATFSTENLLQNAYNQQIQGHFQESIYWYELAKDTGEHKSDPLYYLGYLQNWVVPLDERNPNEALKNFFYALELNDFSGEQLKIDTLYRTGSIQCNHLGKSPDNCIPYYEKLLEIEPTHAFTLMELGRQYYRDDQGLDLAEETIQAAIEAGNEFEKTWAFYHLGELYREVGLLDEARHQYTYALELNPNFEPAIHRLNELE